MIHFSGVFQLASIVKEDTTKSGDKMVLFTAFSRRGDQSDKVFCKCFGNTADYLMRNLTKKSDGKYISRKLYLAGCLETYKQAKMETLDPLVLKPEQLDAQYGVLYESIQLIPTRRFEEDKFMLRVSYLDFEDKKQETEIIEIHRSTANPVVSGASAIAGGTNNNVSRQVETTSSSLASSLHEATTALNQPDLSGIV